MLTIGLTGGIGSGKTTVANYFAGLGITVIDADIIARQIVTAGSPLLKQITQHFGSSVLDETGNLNRNKLRDLVFADPTQRLWLENLLHPVILKEMYQLAKTASSAYCILVMPLLLEKNVSVDRVLVVDCPRDLQIQRIEEQRQLTKKQIDAILATQLTREQRLARADDVINNDDSLTALKEQTLVLHQKYIHFT